MTIYMKLAWGKLDIAIIYGIGYKKVGVNDNAFYNRVYFGTISMKAKYKAKDIANYFIWKASQEEELISNLKLQKLIYYAQGLHLVINNGPLFGEEIRAWSYGPVVSDIYFEYKSNGSNGIRPDKKFDCDKIDDETRGFLDEIYEVFGQFSAGKLMQLSHSDQCWIEANPNKIISHKSMKETLAKYLTHGKTKKSS